MSVPSIARRASFGLLAAIGAAILAGALPAVTGAHDTSGQFVTRSGSELQLDGQPYTFAGINLYNANSDGYCRDELSDTEFGEALDDAGLGGEVHGVLRAWFFQTLATDKGTRARDWTRFDRTIAIAKARGYKVIATLADQWGECGTDTPPTYDFKTEDWYTTGYGAPDPNMSAPGAYGPGWLSYRDWVAEVVARYESEPAILAWQLINEAEVNPGGASGVCPPGDGPRDTLKAWAEDVSDLVRSLDTNHLISLGTIGGGQCGSQGSQFQDVHDLPNIDLCEVHDYSPTQAIPGDQWNGLGVRVQQCAALDKPLIVGETGIIPTSVGGDLEDRALAFRSKLHAQRALGVDGLVAWNFYPGGSTLDDYDIGPSDPALAELANPVPAIVVTSGDDTDDSMCDVTHCSLREAINEAHNQLGTDLIAFAIPGAGVHTITLGSALPDIWESVLIDGSTQPGTAGSPLIVLDGSSAGLGEPGISASADDVTIRGLRITGFDGSGIASTGIGLRVDGSTIDGNGGDGITATGAQYDASISGNRILDNGGLGIDYGDDGPTYMNPAVPSLMGIGQYGDQLSGSISGSSGWYTVEVFKLGSCDPSGYGEGDLPIGSLQVEIPSGFSSYGSFDFTVPGGISLGDTFSATATGPDGATSEFSNCASRPLPNLSLTLDDDRELVGEGEGVRYTLTVSNATNVYANGIVLQHTLPAGATFGQAIPSQGTCAAAAGIVTCQLGSLVSFGFGPGIITVNVDVQLGSAGVAATSATVSATEPETTLADNDANDTTTVAVATPATYTVTSNNDANDGTCSVAHCSLREAIIAANTNPGRDAILFNLTGSTMIQPASPGLPTISGPVVIDATSTPGFTGQPVVVMRGPSPLGGSGFTVAGGDSEIRGFILNSWQSTVIRLERWGGNTIAGNWFGLDATGLTSLVNGSWAIDSTTSNNVIGGSTAADRNVVAGGGGGIRTGLFSGGAPEPHDNVIQGNWVGLNATGTTSIPGGASRIVAMGDDHVIGGTAAGEGNVVVGSTQDGILVTGDSVPGQVSTGNSVRGNIVGLDPTGTIAMPNQTGIRVHRVTNGTLVEDNTVGSSTGDGINVFNGPQDTFITGNRIGVGLDGVTAQPNGRHGIILQGGASPRTTIGGTAPGAGNVIAFNGQDGVYLEAGGAAVLGNSIHSNGGMGIDRTPPLLANSDTISNTPASHAFPVLTAAVTQNGLSTVAGTLASSGSTTYRIELFGNAVCDPIGNGEGQTFLAGFNVTTNGSGAASFTVALPAPMADGTVITATSTSTATGGQTSEFSACRTSGPPPPESTSGTGATGSTTTTDTEGDGATPTDPIETSVSVPATVVTPGTVTITEQAITGTPPANYGFFGSEVVITGPVASAAVPLVLEFLVDASAIPSGENASTIVVFRNGIPVQGCTAPDASATPDPCVFSRETLTGAPWNGDIRLTVRTSAASTWNVGQSFGPPPFNFAGFFEPVNNPPVTNRVNAGRAIPVKFSLGGDEGLSILASDSPSSRKVACDTSSPLDAIETTVAAGGSSLSYDATTGVYTYVWKTNKAWKGTCRQLTVTLTDGTSHVANFRFD